MSLEAKLAEIKPLFKEEQRAQSGVDDPRLEVAREISHSLSQIAEMLSGFLDDYYGKEKYRR